MAQQPLTGRGLSQTILQPTDILGEAQARQQQEQMLAARQQAAQKPPKAYEYEGIERYGNLYSEVYNSIEGQISDFARENAYKLHPESPYYDKELRRKFDIAVRNSNEAASLMFKNSENFYKDYDELDPSQRSNSGALGLIEKISNLGGKVKIDFETGLPGIEGEDGEFQTFDEVDYITNPRAYYYVPKDWKDLTLDGLDKVYVDIEDMEGGSIKQADLEKIKNQVDIFYNDLDNSVDFQYSVIADYLEGVIGIPGAEKNASNIIRSIIQDGEYVRKDGSVISREEALDWGKNQATNAFIAQHGLTVDKAKGSGNLEFNFVGHAQKIGVAPIFNMSEFRQPAFKNPKGVTIKTDKIQIPVPEDIYGLDDDEFTEDIKSYVDNIYTEGNDVYVDLRGVRSKGKDLIVKRQPLNANQTRQLQANLGLPTNVTVVDFVEGVNQGQPQQEKKSDTEQNTISISKARKDLPDLLGNLSDEEIREMYEEDGYKVIE